MTLELSLLGRFALTSDGEQVELKNKKAQALLAYLALTEKAHSREHLATLLWGDRFDDQARSSLRQALFALRKALSPEVIEGDDELRLNTKTIKIESLVFKTENPYPGALLSNFQSGEGAFDDWLRDERNRLEDRAVQTYRQGAERAATKQNHLQALELSRRVLDLCPLDEALVRLAMRALAELGQRGDALKQYSDFVEHLSLDLSAEPELETVELSEQIRQSQPTSNSTSEEIPGYFIGKTVVAPIEDLGGGDLASFLAHELPKALVEFSLKNMVLDIVELQIPGDSQSTADLIAAAKAAEGVFITAGSTRQIGDKVRIALQALTVGDGKVFFSHNEIIPADEAFSFLERIGEVFQSGVQSCWGRAVPVVVDYSARLESLKGSELRFITTLNEYFVSVFLSDNTLVGFEAMDQAADLAVSLFPKNPFCLQFKGWAVYSRWDMSEGGQRHARYQEANSYFERALSIDPGQKQALTGRLSVSYWLGDFAATDATFDLLGDSFKAWPVLKAIYANSLIFRDQIDQALKDYAPVLIHEAGTKVLLNRHAMIGLAHFCRKDYGEALKGADSSLEIGPDYWVSHLVRIAALERLGMSDQTATAIKAYADVYPSPNVSELNWLPFVNGDVKADLLTALESAGLPKE